MYWMIGMGYYVLSSIITYGFVSKIYKLQGDDFEKLDYVFMFVPGIRLAYFSDFLKFKKIGLEKANRMFICYNCQINFRAGASSFLYKDSRWEKIVAFEENVRQSYHKFFKCPNCQSNFTEVDNSKQHLDIPIAPKFNLKQLLLLDKQTNIMRKLWRDEKELETKKEDLLYIDGQLEKYAKLNEAVLDGVMKERLEKINEMRSQLKRELDEADSNHSTTFLEEVNRLGKLKV